MRDFSFSIDRGGTFTDVFAECPDRQYRVLKLLSEDPSNYDDAPREGIRRILEQVTGQPHPRDQKLDTSRIASIRMGTTVATNALLVRGAIHQRALHGHDNPLHSMQTGEEGREDSPCGDQRIPRPPTYWKSIETVNLRPGDQMPREPLRNNRRSR